MTICPPNRLRIALLVAPCILGFTPRTARAQRADSVARRDSILRSDSTYRLAPISVQASIVPVAGPTIGSGVPARVTRLTGASLKEWTPRILPDVLGTVVGVSIYDDLGSQYKLNVGYRGFNVGPTVGLPPGLSVFLDGVRQNEADAAEVDFDLLPMNHVSRIELLSGTASLLGANSLGGAINLVTDRGEGPAHASFDVSVGSYGKTEVNGTVAGKSDKSGWDYYLGGGYDREDGWRNATNGEKYNGFVNVGHFGLTRGIGMQALVAKSRAETAGSLPESRYSDARINFTPGDVENLDMQTLNVTGYVPMGGGRGTLTLFGKRFNADRFNVNQAPDPNVDALTRTYTFGGTADWRRLFTVGAHSLALRLGVDGSNDRVRVQIVNSPNEATQDVSNSDSDSDSDSDDALGVTTDVKSPSRDLAAYALVDFTVGRVTFSTGARYDDIRVPFRNQLKSDDNTANTFTHISPRGGISVDAGHGFSLYGSAGGSFRAPAIVELGCADPTASCPLPFALGDDPPLSAVRASTFEVGGNFLRGVLRFDASIYRTNVRNELFFIQSPGSLVSGYFINLDKTRREGVELSAASAFLHDAISWYANYAHTSATFESEAQIFSTRADEAFEGSPLFGANHVTPGSIMPLVPFDQLKTGFAARLPHAVRVGLDARWIGKQYLRGDEGNEQMQLESYFVLGVRAGHRWRNWDVSGVATNVLGNHAAIFGTFNENATTGELERFLTPLNARTFILKISRTVGARAY